MRIFLRVTVSRSTVWRMPSIILVYWFSSSEVTAEISQICIDPRYNGGAKQWIGCSHSPSRATKLGYGQDIQGVVIMLGRDLAEPRDISDKID